jgi:hypothetical protein
LEIANLVCETRAEDQPVMPTVWHSFKLRR